MKILHVNDTSAADGGVGRYVSDVSELLQQAGHSGWLAYQYASEAGGPAPVRGMSGLRQVPSGGGLDSRVERLIDEVRPDVAYIHYADDPAFVQAIARRVPSVGYAHGFRQVCPGQAKLMRVGDSVCTRRFGAGCVPTIYFRRCSGARHPKSVARIMRMTARYRDVFLELPRVVVSGAFMRGLLEQNGFIPERIVELAPHFESPREATEPDADGNTVLFSGRLEYEKGIPYLLNAMAASRSKWHLEIAGDGSLRGEYERMAVRLGIADRVRYLGWLSGPELKAAYARSSVLVMPSLMPEPFGKVGIEALATGRPVVAFRVGGIPDWLVDGVTGALVSARDSNALRDAIDELMVNADRRRQMGRAAKQHVAEHFSPSQHLQTLERVFGSVLAEPVS